MFNAIQNAMQANPDAIAIASVDCCSIVGAAKWAEQADRAGDIVIVGTDALQQTLKYIETARSPSRSARTRSARWSRRSPSCATSSPTARFP